MKIAAISDYRERARKRVPHFLFEYIDGGSYGEETLRRNITDLTLIQLRQRVLRDVSALNLEIELFGQKYSKPVALAPIGLAGMNARRGEVQAARAAALANIPFCLSTVSACSIAEVAADAMAPFWFQLYMIRDRSFMRDLLEAASEARCSALVFTVDMPVPGSRYRDYRSGLAGAPGFKGSVRRIFQALQRPAWTYDVGIRGRPHTLGNVAPVLGRKSGLEDFFAWMRNNFDPTVTWNELDWIRSHWRGPLIIKGILDPADARSAATLGANGIVVSNHGGRQLDGVPSTAQALPPIVDAVGDQISVLVDGGVRSGLDVLRMLALGANCVLLGRAWAYALAADGEAGVTRMLELLESELSVAMCLTGCSDVASISKDIISR